MIFKNVFHFVREYFKFNLDLEVASKVVGGANYSDNFNSSFQLSEFTLFEKFWIFSSAFRHFFDD
jgi:hypothetical protein